MVAQRRYVAMLSFCFLVGFYSCVDFLRAQESEDRGPPPPIRIGSDAPTRMIRSKMLQRELVISEDQLESLRNLSREVELKKKERLELIKLTRGLTRAARNEIEWRNHETMLQIEEEQYAEAAKVLLPHQMKRFDQIVLWSSLDTRFKKFLHETLVDQLEYSFDQIREIRELSDELQRDYDERIERKKEELEDDIQKVLSAEQRIKLESLLGEPFDFSK